MGRVLVVDDEQGLRDALEVLITSKGHVPTTAKSVAGKVASQEHIPTITRNVFLDNVQQEEDIDREFRKLLKMAKERGVAVGIRL